MATNWEERYQLKDTPWDKGRAHPELLQWLTIRPMNGNVLVPGCGLGHDVRAIAATADEVLGLDIATSAIKAARSYSQVGAETFLKADLFKLPARFHQQFHWVWEQTCFCAIDPACRPDYVHAVSTALKPGGHLLACFYLDPGLDPGEPGPPFGVSKPELDALFGSRFTQLTEWTPSQTFPGREGRELMRLLQRNPV